MVDVRTSRGRHAIVFGFIFFLVLQRPASVLLLGILVSVLLAGLTTPTVTVVQE